jgi:predicted SnoaL-like aldol condensation-catalyzing enzyme
VLFSLAVGLLAAAILVEPLPAVSHAAAHESVVNRFYDAVNDAIATGSLEAIRTVVAPHLVEHDALPGMRPGRDGLEDYLTALHAADPNPRLVTKTVLATGDRVVARVTVHGATAPTLSGGAFIDAPAPWGSVDIFRIAAGKIVERWGDNDGLTLVRPLAEIPILLPVPSPRVVTLDRLQSDSGGSWSASATGPRLFHVEEGSLRLDVETPALARPAPSRVETLSAGRSLAVPAGARVEATNVGAGAMRLLVVTFAVPNNPGGAPPVAAPPTPGVISQTLAGGMATDLPIGPALLTLEQITLARSASLSLSSVEGPALLALDSGRLDLAAWGRAWVQRGSDGGSIATDEARLAAGDGLQLHPGGLSVLSNASDEAAVALVLTIRPAQATS